MRKTLLFTLLSFLCVLMTHAAETTYTYKSWSKKPNLGDNNLDNVTWNIGCDNTSVNREFSGSSYLKFGSQANDFTSLTFSSSDFAGTISKVEISAKVSRSEATITPSVTVGGTKFTASPTGNVATTQTTYKFTGSASGKVVLSFDGDSNKKQLYLYSISVTYDPDATSPVTPAPDAPVFYDNNMTEISGTTLTMDAAGEIYCELADGVTPSYSVTPEDAATFSLESGLYTISVTKSCSITVTATNAGGATSSTLNVTVKGSVPPTPAPDAPIFMDGDTADTLSGEITVDAGKTIIAGCSTSDKLTYTAEPSDAVTATVSGDNTEIDFVVNKSCIITATATNAGGSTSSTLKVTVNEQGGDGPISGTHRFVKVTSDADIVVGEKYIITNGSKSSDTFYSLKQAPNTSNGAIPAVNDAIKYVDATQVDVNTEKVAVFTIVDGYNEGSTTYKALQYATGEYLTLSENDSRGFSSAETPTDVSAVKITHGTTYTTIKFNKHKRSLRYYNNNNDFRAYSGSNGSGVYLYRLAKPKTTATLNWDNNEYTYDLDFGWPNGKRPVLNTTPEGLTVSYSSSDTGIAEIDANGNITAKATGTCTITASVPDNDPDYTAAPASFTLKVEGGSSPVFADSDGITELSTIALLPAQLSAGYTIKVKAAAGCGVKVEAHPAEAATITYTAEGADVTVTGVCSLEAVSTKGETVAVRSVIFTVTEKPVPFADIKWNGTVFVYNLSTQSWNVKPSLINTASLPVTFTSSVPGVATISAGGVVTPIAKGTTTITAVATATDDYKTTTTSATVRVTDNTAPDGFTVYELVTKKDQLQENEQFIIVSGDKYKPDNGTGSEETFWALSPYRYIDTDVRDYYEAVPVELLDENDINYIKVANDAHVLRLSKQFDTSAENANYPYLFQVMNEDVDLNNNGKIDDVSNVTVTTGNNERINGRYIHTAEAKLFSFTDLPSDVNERGKMNGMVQVLDPEVIPGYIEQDYRPGSSSPVDFTDKAEIIFNDKAAGDAYFCRFNTSDNAYHFNLFSITDNDYDPDTRSKTSTLPVRIYRLAQRVEKPSITVYPEEPEASDVAYQQGVVYNNKVRVVIEKHPKTSAGARMLRTWQKEGHIPAVPDYTDFGADKVTAYVDGHNVYDENGTFIRSIDPDFSDPNSATRTLYAISRLDNVQSVSAQAKFIFRTIAPKIAKVASTEGIRVRISCPGTYTRGAVLYYVISANDAKPSVTFNQDGTIASSTGTEITPWYGDETDTESGYLTLQQGEQLWVGAFKAGYEPAMVEFDDFTVFPECRALQLLRLTEKGCLALNLTYDPAKPKYINYRDDIKDEAGNPVNTDHHYHYLIERTHTYGQETNRHIEISQISKEDFHKVFGPDYDNVAPEYAGNFLWTSDYYVFALNEADFKAKFGENDVTNINVQVITPSRTYTALYNSFNRTQTNADGSLASGATPVKVGYYGTIIEDQGRLGVKTISTELTYSVNGSNYATEAHVLTTPRIPSAYGFSYKYEYTDPDPANLQNLEEYAGKDFIKFTVKSAIENRGSSDVLVPISEVNPRHLDVVFTFRRPNISPLILQHYDIYYDIKFCRVDESNGTAVRTLLPGSGVYVDDEQDRAVDDGVYRFRVSDVLPNADINPEIEIADCRFVGNTQNEAYSSFASNFGNSRMSSVIEKNSEHIPMNVSEFWVAPGETHETDGVKSVDWMYIAHKDLEDRGDILVKDSDNNQTVIHSLFYHVEAYIPGTDYYNSYEYLVKHDGTHTAPEDPNHPYFSDNAVGEPAGQAYDRLRYTVIARNFPCGETPWSIVPNIVVTPVYIFAHSGDMLSEPVTDGVGKAGITKLTDAEGISATAVSAKDAAAVAATGSEAPSNSEYPMPHTGVTDMNHPTIYNATGNASFGALEGGTLELDSQDDNLMTGIEDIISEGNTTDSETVRYYNLQGLPVENPGHGFYIRVEGNKACKVVR